MRKKTLLCILFLIILCGNELLASGYGIVVDFSGSVKYKKGPDALDWSKVSYFMDIPEGAVIKTGKNSTLVIQKADGKLMRILENAEIQLKGITVKEKPVLAKIIKVPDSIDRALQEKIQMLRAQFAPKAVSTKTARYRVMPAPLPTASGSGSPPSTGTVPEPVPTAAHMADPLFIPARSLVRSGRPCFAWEGVGERYDCAIYMKNDMGKPVFTENRGGSSWILPGASKFLKPWRSTGSLFCTSAGELKGPGSLRRKKSA